MYTQLFSNPWDRRKIPSSNSLFSPKVPTLILYIPVSLKGDLVDSPSLHSTRYKSPAHSCMYVCENFIYQSLDRQDDNSNNYFNINTENL